MPSQLYEILAQGASYWFAFLGVVIVWRSFAWLRKDGRARRKRVRQLPDAGLIGEMVVVQGAGELPEGTALPLPLEGVMGSLRLCDVFLPVEGAAGKHLTFRFIKGKGLVIEPWPHQRVWVDGEEYTHRGKHPIMLHGSRLQIGQVVLRMRLFMGVEAGRTAQRQRYMEPEKPMYQPFPEDFEAPEDFPPPPEEEYTQPLMNEFDEAPCEEEPEAPRGLFARRR